MAPTTLIAERFGGLNLAADPQELGWAGATDLLNVDFDQEGALSTRPGSTKLNSSAFSTAPQIAINWPALGGIGVLRTDASGIYLDKLTTGGTVTNVTGGAGSLNLGYAATLSSAVIGGSSASALYMVVQNTGTGAYDFPRKIQADATANTYDGKPKFLATWGPRIVQGWYSASANSPSGLHGGKHTVFFSNADGDTVNDDDWVDLDPGDGTDGLMGMVEWRNELYVFKRNAMYVFYGIATDSTGGAIFNYRKVSLPARFESASAGLDGVYVALADGIYRTRGDVPEEVSRPIRPLFTRTASTNVRRDGDVTLTWVVDKLYARYTNTANSATRTLVLYPRSGQWSIWGLASSRQMLSIDFGSGGETPLWMDASNIYKLDTSTATDNGTAIASSYLTGFQTVASGLSARLRNFYLYGVGTITHTLYGDLTTASQWTGTAATSVALGTSPVSERAVALQSGRCRALAIKLSAASGAWLVSRWEGRVMDVRSY